MIFDFQQFTMTGGVITYPDFPFDVPPRVPITENPVVVGSDPGQGAVVNITGSTGGFTFE